MHEKFPGVLEVLESIIWPCIPLISVDFDIVVFGEVVWRWTMEQKPCWPVIAQFRTEPATPGTTDPLKIA